MLGRAQPHVVFVIMVCLLALVLFCFFRIKRGIMSEFHKKKHALEQSLQHKRDSGSHRLDERLQKKKKRVNALQYDDADDTGE